MKLLADVTLLADFFGCLVLATLIVKRPQNHSLRLLSTYETKMIQGENQIPLTGGSEAGNTYAAKITDYSRVTFLADIQIGTPPQPFRAVVDISWADLFVPSTKCDSSSACSVHQLYNSSNSKTYVEHGDPTNIHYAGIYTSGFKSEDTLRVAGLEIKNQIFEEATSLRPSPFYRDDKMDSVLGLSRFPLSFPGSDLSGSTSPWHNLIKQKRLKKNIFSIKVSKSPYRDGEIMFGDVNPKLFEGGLMSIPTTHKTHEKMPLRQMLGSGWQVEAHSLSFGFGPEAIHADLSGYAAIFMTAYPWISFPRALAEQLQDRCGGDYDNMGQIECVKRAELPDLIVRLGTDCSVVISPWDYVLESPAEGGGIVCSVPFVQHEEPDDEPKYMILGAAFLAGVYSVFDQNGGTISREFYVERFRSKLTNRLWRYARNISDFDDLL
ncbi:Vacuolar protease A [Lachnellula suecica]|uniref:Vacuolar protease A n=1 Tax=Lachnellula suecica TaxID=602035 RepID=A0A8T9C6W6_9HELO|nr:Vacuolar protease A [Lachnellula suecica]